jgi:hypothetical protein
MSRVDHGVDALGPKIRGKTLGAAEAAGPLRDRRGRGIRGRPRERQKRLDAMIVRQAARERVCFRRSAEDEKAKAYQGAAP